MRPSNYLAVCSLPSVCSLHRWKLSEIANVSNIFVAVSQIDTLMSLARLLVTVKLSAILSVAPNTDAYAAMDAQL